LSLQLKTKKKLLNFILFLKKKNPVFERVQSRGEVGKIMWGGRVTTKQGDDGQQSKKG
jgi:hypothetical protein